MNEKHLYTRSIHNGRHGSIISCANVCHARTHAHKRGFGVIKYYGNDEP